MSRERLLARFLSEGGTASPDALRAVDFARLLVHITTPSVEEVARRRPVLLPVLQARCGLPPEETARLLDVVLQPAFRSVANQLEMEAFTARFGLSAAALVAEEQGADLSLADFRQQGGAAEALGLLDAMYEVFSRSGGLDIHSLHRLEAAAEALGVDLALRMGLHRKHDPQYAAGAVVAPLRGDRLRIGRAPAAELVLADPQVAPFHAELTRTEHGWRVVDAGSGRPTLLNDRPIQAAPFTAGDHLRVGSVRITLDPTVGQVRAVFQQQPAALSVQGLSRTLAGSTLIEKVRFTVFSGEVVAVVGDSGAGKTTLINAIAGITPADQGEVRLDGVRFDQLLAADRSVVGLVPQDDIVHPELTVEESLLYSARLRSPAGTPEAVLQAHVDRVIGELGLDAIRSHRIGDALRRGISGGQRKRVNLGQELLTGSTRILFVDEPTSGLDPRSASDITRLLRQLAYGGRIVFLVTHDLGQKIVHQVDHLLVLTQGGRVAWFGPPQDACRYFGVDTPDAIFSRFHLHTPEEWAARFAASPAFQTYVVTREHVTPPPAAPPAPAPRASLGGHAWAHFQALSERYWRIKLRDTSGMKILFVQAPVLAAVMAVVFPKPTAGLLFMLSLSCIWFGMSAAVRELIADRVIWRRERRAGVGVSAYVASRLVVLAALATVQSSALALLTWWIHDLPTYGFALLPLAGVCSLAGLVGMSLGLLVSALFASSEAAIGTLPLLLIPQMTFSSMLVSLRHMPALALILSALNPARYALDALLKVGTQLAQAPRYGSEWPEPQPMTATLYELGFKPAGAEDMGLPLPVLCAVLTGYCVVFCGLTWLVEQVRASRKG